MASEQAENLRGKDRTDAENLATCREVIIPELQRLIDSYSTEISGLRERVRLLERIVVLFNPPFSSWRMQELPAERAVLQEVLNAATEPIR